MADLIVYGEQWNAMQQQAAVLIKSKFLPSSITTPEQATAIMLKGREMGIPPMQAFSHIHIINGKPTMSAELMLAMIYKHVPGASIDFIELSDSACKIEAKRPNSKPFIFCFSMDDAKKAGITNNPTWSKYTRAMLRSRCISEMARSMFPDAIQGVSYTPEELGAVTDDRGEIIDIQTPKKENVEQKPVFNPENESHVKFLREKLSSKGVILRDEQDEVINLMRGKTSDQIDPIISYLRGETNLL